MRRQVLAMSVAALTVAVCSQTATAAINKTKLFTESPTSYRGYIDDCTGNQNGPDLTRTWTQPALPNWSWVIVQKNIDNLPPNTKNDYQIWGVHTTSFNKIGPLNLLHTGISPLAPLGTPNQQVMTKTHPNGQTDRLVVRADAVGGGFRISIFLDHNPPAFPALPVGPVVATPCSALEDEVTVAGACNPDGPDSLLSDCDNNEMADACESIPTGAMCGSYGCYDVTDCESAVFSFLGKKKANGTACETQPNCDGVPAVSEWGLVALTIAMLAVGTIVLRRRVAAA